MRSLTVWTFGTATLLALVPATADARFPWFGKKRVERVAIAPAAVTAPPRAERPDPPASGRSTCIAMNRVAGAQMFGDQAVEVTVSGGNRWRLYFAQSCPALSFYEGFYYRRAEVGMLCAGRDAVISRSGGECGIASIMPMKRLSRRPSRMSMRPRH